jgi:hypothetical protein
MRPLIITWSTLLVALAAFGAWLWFTPIPKTQAGAVTPVVVQGDPIPVTTGPIVIDLEQAKQKQKEDCPLSC